MAINLDAIRGRLNKLQSTTSKTVEQWKPTPGKHQIRLVPYKFNKENPFIELLFHYGINNKTYLSPSSFGRPDPIVEFAEKLKRMGDKEDWKAAKKMEPKLRTFVPVLVRGEEGEGVRFWGFGKTVYQEILGYIADPDYGDITDPNEGRDIVVEIVSAEDSGTSYPVTTIRVKPKESALADNKETTDKFLNEQKNITELYSELSYAELKNVLESWLNPSAGGDDESVESTSTEELSKVAPSAKTESHDMGGSTPAPKAAEAPAKKLDDVAAAFDDLFNS
jgi:Asp-tRNA(Asn)/Glu-tRNA(Gln) amidotransferase C subunit